MRMPVVPALDKDGWLFVGIFALIALLLSAVSDFLGYLGWILTGWCAYFFRDPQRITPVREGLIIAPADGVISAIVEDTPPEELGFAEGKWLRISTFLNVFDVHVNRVPISGRIIRSIYHPGKFLNASLDKASKDNERQSLVVEADYNKTLVGFVQIAGLVARRIRCDVSVDQEVKTGNRFGMIRFGSRVDVYLPAQFKPLVVVGQRMIAGETVMADLTSQEEQRLGEIR